MFYLSKKGGCAALTHPTNTQTAFYDVVGALRLPALQQQKHLQNLWRVIAPHRPNAKITKKKKTP
ncbi:hypothetical protein ACQV24_11835, partial [Cronobacter sakazakii]|uniref:hypothetical protein n=1 Tax=Cronobacter sakazakii TaxID=28141 RepID=UPI003D186E65